MTPGRIHLQSRDGKTFEVAIKVINCSHTLKKMMAVRGITETTENQVPIPLSNITGATLKKVLEWADHHKDDCKAPSDPQSQEHVVPNDGGKAWDSNFFKMDIEKLCYVAMAAASLDIDALLVSSRDAFLAIMREYDSELLQAEENGENMTPRQLNAFFKKVDKWKVVMSRIRKKIDARKPKPTGTEGSAN